MKCWSGIDYRWCLSSYIELDNTDWCYLHLKSILFGWSDCKQHLCFGWRNIQQHISTHRSCHIQRWIDCKWCNL